MRQHDERRSIDTHWRKAEYSEYDKPQVADRRIRDQLLHIGLNKRDQSTIDNADQGQRDDPGCILSGFLRKESKIKTQHSVSAHLEKHSRQQNRSRCGRFDVSVGKPCMKWKQRHLHGKCNKESKEEPASGSCETVDLPIANS